MHRKQLLALLSATFSAWWTDNCLRLGASLASVGRRGRHRMLTEALSARHDLHDDAVRPIPRKVPAPSSAKTTKSAEWPDREALRVYVGCS